MKIRFRYRTDLASKAIIFAWLTIWYGGIVYSIVSGSIRWGRGRRGEIYERSDVGFWVIMGVMSALAFGVTCLIFTIQPTPEATSDATGQDESA